MEVSALSNKLDHMYTAQCDFTPIFQIF